MTLSARECLAALVNASATTKYAVGLHHRRELAVRAGDVERGRQRHEVDEVFDRRHEPALDEHRGHEPVDEPAQLGRRRVEAAAQILRPVQHVRHVPASVTEPAGLQTQEHQLHLQAVVQVLRDAAPLVVGCSHEPGAGVFEVAGPAAEFGGEPLAVELDGDDPADGDDVVGVRHERRVVRDAGDGPAVPVDLDDGPAGSRASGLHRAAVGVDLARVRHRCTTPRATDRPGRRRPPA